MNRQSTKVELLRFVGVLTEAPHMLIKGAYQANLQDTTGGIALFARDPGSLPIGRFQRGDIVRVRGTVAQYKGAEEVLVQEILLISHGEVPAPRALLRVFGDTWRVIHAGTALLTGGAIMLIADYVYFRFPVRQWRSAAALAAALPVAGSVLVVKFATAGQGYGLCLFLMVAAFRLSISAVDSATALRAGLAGCFAAAAAIHAERDRKLEAARKQRQIRRKQAA